MATAARLASIDAVRGLVMVIMLLDHVRDTLGTHWFVGDPMDARLVAPALFFSRTLASLCAPTFIALTGLSAWLYGQTHSRAETSRFLLTRGLFLMLLEVTLVGFAWSAQFPPQTIWLQVIWAIGVCMIALAGLIHLPRGAVAAIGLAIVAGHNLLDPIAFAPDSPWFKPWALIHKRSAFEWMGITIKTTYPVLPWIGVIALGYAIGPWFTRPAGERRRWLAALGLGLILGFILLRTINGYGDAPWAMVPGDPLRSVMSFLALTKYPPSLLFLLSTLGVAALLLALFEGRSGPIARKLAVMGGAPMGFYLLHLYVLRGLYLGAVAIWGTNQGQVFGLSSVGAMWLVYLLLIVPLYYPTRWFAELKRRRRDLRWLRYF
ncbi:membrane protein [Sphingomonas yabuuchiae]|uniref:Membrane protein n=2 Tax=Sphingomonas yabuuchiae TaxID=172044 RepID=A0A147IKB3_9SPHN|nr:membrane protein [Sphingomonas yabuuchiae]